MKKIYLMRHAKSSWKNPFPDHNRPLNKRGKRAAKAVGKALKKRGVDFDRILCSSAKRAVSTARRLLKAMKSDKAHLCLDPRLYTDDAGQILERIRALDDESASVLIIGHNPALSDCAVLLSGADRFAWLPTGALVGLAFDTDTWNDLDVEKGEVILTLFPRELEEE